MTENTKNVLSYYEDYTNRAGEENRATSSRSASLEFHYTTPHQNPLIYHHSNICLWLQ